MSKCSGIYLIFFFISIISSFVGLQSCTNLSSNPDENTNQTSSKIQISSPSSNSTISEGENRIFYSLAQPYSLKFIELYIDNIFTKNISPNSDGTLPLISFKIDSTYIGKEINLFLIYYDNDGTSIKSNTVTQVLVTQDNRIPFKPYNISWIKFSDSSCNISWKDSSLYVEKYELWRKIGFKGEYILLQELIGKAFNTNDYGLDTNKIYFYKLRGIKSSGASEFSDEVNTAGIVTSGDLYPPSNLTAAISGTAVVTLNWNDNSNNENYFSVERSLDNINFNSIAALSKNTTTFKDSGKGLLIGETYNYKIKAYSNTDSAQSNTITIRIASNILLPPSNLTAVYDSTIGVIELDWINNDNNILFIDVERKTENSNFAMIRRLNTGNNLYLDFGITGNQIYTYRIRGYDLNTYSDYSNEVTISTF